MKQMTTQEAVRYVLKTYNLSMYAVAKAIQISPIMVGHYKYGRNKMGVETAKRFQATYDIEITDAKPTGVLPNE